MAGTDENEIVIFRILKGNSSRISINVTPFHDGWCYFTSDDGKLYIDSEDNGEQKRICINPTGSGISRAVAGTLTKEGWSDGRQILQVAGMSASQNGYIGTSQEATDVQAAVVKKADLRICGQTDGFLTISASGDVPQIDIPVVVILFE